MKLHRWAQGKKIRFQWVTDSRTNELGKRQYNTCIEIGGVPHAHASAETEKLARALAAHKFVQKLDAGEDMGV